VFLIPSPLPISEMMMNGISKPIYKILVSRNLEPWFQLSLEEQKKIIAKLDEEFEKVGGQRPVLCDTSWSSDKWYVGAVEIFPSIEAVQEYMMALKRMNWSRYCESKNILGTELESEW
jgi:hypothetical protein